MPKTPQEIANLPVNDIETRNWLHDASAKDNQAYQRAIVNKPYAGPDRELARVALQVRIAEDQSEASEQLEHHTRVLVDTSQSLLENMKLLLEETKALRRLTVGLLVFTVGLLLLTAALLVFAIGPVVLPQRFQPHNQDHAPTSKNHQPTNAQPAGASNERRGRQGD